MDNKPDEQNTVGAVIITHGHLAESLLDVAGSITGDMEGALVVSVTESDSTEELRDALSEAVKKADTGGGVIIFTDMFGGTPSNIAFSLFKAGRVDVVTGVNLPMLLKFVSNRTGKALEDLAVLLKESGQQSIELAGDMLKEK